jgi:hypothetical protein
MPTLPVLTGSAPETEVWHSKVTTSLTEAEQFLDQSDADGYREQWLVICRSDLFVARWR